MFPVTPIPNSIFRKYRIEYIFPFFYSHTVKTMKKTKIKICGLTIPAQAVAVEEAGADMIGLVFADSPRRVSIEQATDISGALKSARAIGVFVNSTPSEINRIAEVAGLEAAQLHGDEPPEMVRELAIPYIKAFKVTGPDFIDEIKSWISRCGNRAPEAVLLDTFSIEAAGGTGKTFNWEYLGNACLSEAMDDLPPFILAGGLCSENITEAIITLHPWAVDCSSGVEAEPGIKDIGKVKLFIRTVQAAL